MAVDVTGLAVGAAVGAGDIAFDKWDANSLRTGAFKTAVDISRVGYVVAGVGAQMMAPRYNKYAVPLVTAGMPLLVRTLYNAFMATTPVAGRSRTGFIPQRRAAPTVPSKPPVGLPQTTPQSPDDVIVTVT